MSKKVKFTINGSDRVECDQFVVMKLADPKKSNTLLFRIVRPATTIQPAMMIYIETPWDASGPNAAYNPDNCFVSCIEQDSAGMAKQMLGISGEHDDEVASYMMLWDSDRNMCVGKNIDAYVAVAHTSSGILYPLNQCNFICYVHLPNGEWRISNTIVGSDLVDGSTIYVTQSWHP